MSQQNKGIKAFVAGEDLEAYRRVKLSDGSGSQVEYADQSDSDGFIGITQAKAVSGDAVAVALKTRGRTFKAVADGSTIAPGTSLYAADDGKVSATASGNVVATALESSTSDLEVIEVLPS